VEWAQAYTPFKIYHDIGLLRLDRDAVIVKNVLQPICLPLTFDKSDIVRTGDFNAEKGLEVFTSGWGRVFSACVTDELGPVKGLKCKAPFHYRGNEITGCSRTRTPSAKDRDCSDFRRKNKKEYPKEAGDSIKIVIGNATKTCFSVQSRDGWCKTESQGEATYGGTVDDSQWGWCESHCKYRTGTKLREKKIMATRLQETKLDVLPMEHCRHMTTSGDYQFLGKWEMCAGKKKEFHNITTYIKEGKKYKKTTSMRDMMGLKGPKGTEYPYNYYISGTDSCSGDSGGGLYTWRDGIPTLLGVVSRGFGSGHKNGCAERNFPGIYSRVSRYLEWIHKNSKSGNC